MEWAYGIATQCRTAGVPFFVKQLDLGGRLVADLAEFPYDLRIREYPW